MYIRCCLCGNTKTFGVLQEITLSSGATIKLAECLACRSLVNITALEKLDLKSNKDNQGAWAADFYKLDSVDKEDIVKMQRSFKAVHEFLFTHCDVPKKETMVDYGCGQGFMAAAGTYYYDHVFAVDVNLDVINSRIPYFQNKDKIICEHDLSALNGKANVIYAWHVLEHLLDIQETIRSFKNHLFPDGVIFFQVPMFSHEESRLVDSHFTFMNELSLRMLCEITDLNLIGCWVDEENDFLSAALQIPETDSLPKPMSSLPEKEESFADYSYYDEDYFQNGERKGTAYKNYCEMSLHNPIDKCIARALVSCFQPSRVLEIGCGVGGVVQQLTKMGIEAVGIDVSEWAIKNKVAANIHHASVDNLPFEDDRFDLIFSCHSLEHISPSFFEQSLREMTRVAKPSAIQFHMLPMIGECIYKTSEHVSEQDIVTLLQKDPTHQQLHSKQQWVSLFGEYGWKRLDATVVMESDTPNMELTLSQFALYRGNPPISIAARIANHNAGAYLNYRIPEKNPDVVLHYPADMDMNLDNLSLHRFKGDGSWQDLSKYFGKATNFKNGQLYIIVQNASGNNVNLRAALITEGSKPLHEKDNVLERWMTFSQGTTFRRFSCDNLSVLSGSPDISKVVSMHFGGLIEQDDIDVFAQLVQE